MRRMILLTILLLLTAAMLAACGGGSSDDAPRAVEAYLQALVDEDSAKLSTLSCKDWEEQAMMELDSFIGVDASLKDAACKQTGADGDTVLVECTGSVQATYGNEQQELPLGGRTYKVVKEGGESLVCGYKQTMRWLFNRENLWALVLCLIVIAVLVMTADSAPLWIYQGFQMALINILILIAAALLIRLLFRQRGRGWALLAASALAVYWMQPALPVRYLDYWLPTLTLALAALCWLLTTLPEARAGRDNWIAAGVMAAVALGVALTRFLDLEGVLTPSRPPQLGQALIFVGVLVLLGWGLSRLKQPSAGLLSGAIVFLLALLVVLKTPALTTVASGLLRTAAGQSAERAAALDLRWLGFSYIAFRLIHTLRDRQNGRLPAVSLQEYLVYALFFPAFTAGPIDRLERFLQDLRRPLEPAADDFVQGGQRLAVGLFKKFALADSLALIALNGTNALQTGSTGWMWVLLYAYSFQIYFDFSGYTDIAIGLGRLLGVKLPENFNHPYLKPNLTQFWNNWHMTLTQWFRAYYFNPLTRGLRRSGKSLPPWAVILITQVSTMLLIGLWHGVTWNFVLWGLWHGLGQFAQNRWSEAVRARAAALQTQPFWRRVMPVANVLLTFHYVALGWVWFALPAPHISLLVLQRLFGLQGDGGEFCVN